MLKHVAALALVCALRFSHGEQICLPETTIDDVLNGQDLSGTSVIVTGGASGLGFAAAASLARHGATVVLADRNQTSGDVAAAQITEMARNASSGGRALFLSLDLSSFDSVRTFGGEMARRFNSSELPPLSVLINNAGVGGPTNATTTDEYQLTFEVDYLGHFLLTELLLPQLRSAAQSTSPLRPTVVNVASDVHLHACETAGFGADCFRDLSLVPFPKRTPSQVSVHYLHAHTSFVANQTSSYYGAAKFLNIQHAAELASRESSRGLFAFAVHPGSCNTGHDIDWKMTCTQTYPQSPCPYSAAQGAAVYANVILHAQTNGGYYSRVTGCGSPALGCPKVGCGLSAVDLHGFNTQLRQELYDRSLGWVHLQI